MKKVLCIFLAVAHLLLLMGCSVFSQKVYTHEELTAMPADELLDLFQKNGLKLNDELNAHFTEEEFQECFKKMFESWCRGDPALSHTMYWDVADQTKEIYDKLTRPN